MWYLLALGCSLHTTRTGRVDAAGQPLELSLREGGTITLVVRDEDQLLVWLEGIELNVAGPRAGGRLWVREWTAGMTDGGSTPFLGHLHRFGSTWLIEDRVSGGTYQVEEASLGGLVAHDQKDVLIEGYVVGAHVVHVVSWRALYDAPDGTPRSWPVSTSPDPG
jgi:hypothetical protein